MYVVSGFGKYWDREFLKFVEVYNFGEDMWDKWKSLLLFKFSGEVMSVVMNDEKFYFVSGRGVFFKDGVVYDVVIDLWLEMVFGLKKGWIGFCVVVNGKFYLLEMLVGKLKVYSVEDDEWRIIMVDFKL